MATNIAFYPALIFFNISPNQGNVFAFAGFIKKLFGEVRHCFLSLGDN